MKRMKKRTGGLVLALLALAVAPSLATAQNAVLYEVTENMKVKRNDAARVRVATAALIGSVSPGSSSICPDRLVQSPSQGCAITAFATDNINLATGKGPVRGTFKIVVQDNNLVDGPEVVVVSGSLRGRIDLSPAVLNGLPVGTLSGSWSAQGDTDGPLAGLLTGGTLTGTFRLPFDVGQGVPAYMLNPPAFVAFLARQGAAPAPVRGTDFAVIDWTEMSLGVPTVRLELSFVEQAQSSQDD